jgi:hypothetical protein
VRKKLKKKHLSFHQNGREKMATTTSNNIKSLHEKLRVDSGSFQQLQQGLFFLFITFFLGKN